MSGQLMHFSGALGRGRGEFGMTLLCEGESWVMSIQANHNELPFIANAGDLLIQPSDDGPRWTRWWSSEDFDQRGSALMDLIDAVK